MEDTPEPERSESDAGGAALGLEAGLIRVINKPAAP